MSRRVDGVLLIAIATIATGDSSATIAVDPSPPATPIVTAIATTPPHAAASRPRGLAIRAIADGAPVADAEIVISDGSGALVRARTDREGLARVDLAHGPHELWATSDGLASPIARIADDDGALDLVLAPAARVRVRVHARREDALGIVGGVQLVPLDGDRALYTASLDERGELVFAGVPFGRWRIEAKVSGFVQQAEQIVKLGEPTATIHVPLIRAGTIAGTVVDSTGTPVANATIVLAGQPSAVAPPPMALAATGLRWVHPIASRRWLPVIDGARFAAPRPGARPAECGRGHCGVDLGNTRGDVIHAAADGEIAALFPVSNTEAGRVVVIHHGRGLKSLYMHLDEILPGLAVGQTIRAGDPVGTLGSTGFSRPLPHLHFAITYETGDRTWYLDPEPILRRAVVLAKPRPYEPPTAGRRELAAAPVLQRITTDAHGAFRIDGVAPGTYAAGAFAAGFAASSSASVVVRAGETTEGVVVTLDAGVVVDGRVVGGDGPIEGATVIASAGFGETTHKVAMTTTDRHGEFALRALAGNVMISVTAPRYGDLARAIALDALDTRRGHHREELALTIENAALRGQVLAPNGGGIANATVRVVSGPTRRTGRTDARGDFVLDHVARGHYIVEVSPDDAPAKSVAIDSDRWIEVRVEAGGGLRCVVRDAQSGAALANARVELRDASGRAIARTTDARGVVELRGAPLGDAQLSAHVAGYARTARVIAIRSSPGLADVTLDMMRGAAIEGVVRDRRGRRVPGARVVSGAATAVADRDGNFRLNDIVAGAGVIEAELDGRRGTRPVELAAGEVQRSVDVELADP